MLANYILQIGNLVVPNDPYRLPTLVLDLARIYRAYPKGVIISAHKNLKLAVLLGYSSWRNGSYWNRLSSLKHYGLLEGRPHMRLTELAERLSSAENERDQASAYFEAAMNVALWREFHRRHQFSLPPQDLWKDIAEITECKPQTAKKVESFVREAFEEDTNSIKNFSFNTTGLITQHITSETGDRIEIIAGPHRAGLQFDETGLEDAIKFLKSIKPPKKKPK